jgi:phospholipid/cholesterol/gamma-HCH transport system permease protein
MAEERANPQPTTRKRVRLPDEAGREVVTGFHALLVFLGDTAQLAVQALGTLLRSGLDMSELLKQMAAIGADSIWIVLTITSATGAVFAFYTATLALQFNYTEPVGGTLAYGFLNELGPVLGGVAFAARAGAAIAAEIGAMVVTEQVEALRAMAVSPIRYLVVPRVLAGVLMLPLLLVIGDVAGIFGGYLFAGEKGISGAVFIESVLKYTQTADLIRGLIKTIIFAFLVGIVSCQQGLRTEGGATGVGRSTTNSVVICVVLIFVSDFILTQILAQPSLSP